jgi:hypothetical protein
MMKLLITARDPATALSFEKLIPELLESGRFELRVLCQEPAFQMLQPFVPADTLYAIPKDEFALVLEDAFLRNQFESFQPDAVLTGISGPDTGIDEAVLHYAATHDIHSYALQSFWGDMNQASGALPDTAFVMDDEAIRITHERYPDIENVAIGSIKHIDYRAYDPLKARAEKRPGLVEFDEVVLGFYGQPILEIAGYFETIEALTRQLSNWPRPFKLLYRPHPKETPELQEKTLSLFTEAFGDRVSLDPFLDIKDSLVVCDLVLSAFSTCCFDNLYLNEMAHRPFNASVYLWFEPELIRWWQEYSHLKELPLISEELLLSVDKEEEMLTVLEQGLLEETRQILWHKAKAHLPNPQASIGIMMEKLLSDFEKSKRAFG